VEFRSITTYRIHGYNREWIYFDYSLNRDIPGYGVRYFNDTDNREYAATAVWEEIWDIWLALKD
jgi:hypothetical protein